MWGQNWGQMIWGGAIHAPAAGMGGSFLLAVALLLVGLLLVTRRGRSRGAGVAILALALTVPISVAIASVPNTFVNGQVADATQVNANFAALNNAVVAGPAAYFNNSTSFSQTALSTSGTAVATLTLPAGSYVLQAKFRYQQVGGTAPLQASCAFYAGTVGNGGTNDGSEAEVPPGGAQIDGYLGGTYTVLAGQAPSALILGCYGSSTLRVLNPQFVAVAAAVTNQ
jgi:hypothetical protein